MKNQDSTKAKKKLVKKDLCQAFTQQKPKKMKKKN